MTVPHVIGRYRTTYAAFIFVIIAGIVSALLFLWPSTSHSQEIFMNSNNDADDWNSKDLVGSTSIALCVLVRIHSTHMFYLPVLAHALNRSGFEKIRLYAISVDKDVNKRWLIRTINITNTMMGREKYISTLNFGSFEDDDFGFIPMDRALAYLYKRHERSPTACEYVILTDSNSLYSKYLGQYITPHMRAKKDIIAWNFVSEHYWPDDVEVSDSNQQTKWKIVDTGTEKCVPIASQTAHAPLGVAAYRLAFLKQHNLYIQRSNGTYSRDSAGHFIRTAANLTKNSAISKQTLLHQ